LLSSIRLKNFRAFTDTSPIGLAPLTIIVGPNNAGKSSLLNSLLLLKQSVADESSSEPLTVSGPTVDLGSFDDIVRGGTQHRDRQISIDLEVDKSWAEDSILQIEGLEPTRHIIGNRLSLSFGFDPAANRIDLTKSGFFNGRSAALEARRDSRSGNLVLRIPGFSRTQIQALQPDLDRIILSLDVRDVDAYSGFGDQLGSSLLHARYEALQQRSNWLSLLSGIEHIDPLRDPIPRFTVLGRTASSAEGVGTGGEELLRILRSSRSGKNNPLVRAMDYWVSERFGLLDRLRLVDVDEAGRIISLLGDEAEGMPGINVANMGEGISQLLPIVASILLLPKRGTLLIEQPEIHLPPAAQADLGDFFVWAADASSSTPRQLLVETHSEHLLLRVRRRIAEGEIDPKLVSVLYVEKPRKVARVRQLKIDERGSFEEWPEGFFEEGYEEALQLARAAARQ